MKIALVQTNPVIGDFARNSATVLRWTAEAVKAGCRLAVFPELTLCGYPPQDLLERSDFINAHDRHLSTLTGKITDIGIIIGAIEKRSGSGKPLYNSAFLIDGGGIKARARKQLLPTYDVFDETRYFEPGSESTVACLDGERFGLTVCEDIWFEGRGYRIDPVRNILDTETVSLDFLVNISASPYHHGKINERNAVFSSLCRKNRLPLLYVNQVGGQDSLIFDGRSMVFDPRGVMVASAPGFRENMLIVDSKKWPAAPGLDLPEDSTATVLEALTLGVRDYLHKTGFKTAVIGLSGGIDSAVTAAVACRALGPENVLTVSLPSPYTSRASIDDARELAANLKCGFETISITGAMDAYRETLSPLFQGLAEDVTEQNIQARIRGNLLMALSNKFGHLLLSTGNKSEMAVGYCTLYGDMSGGLAVLSDVPKQMVYALARWLNTKEEIIPERVITRPPTAELKSDQLDQDDLPPYEVLDPILQAYLEEHASIDAICGRGFERKTVEDIVRRIWVNEYKRRQAATGLKVTTKAFGQGRRYPIVQNFQG
ncbi:MAG TPA: NAD+ synthase [Desulfobacteraceae bacterium]|nr:NAD+ synthase [Desulfobacteraceae bacterium]